jgi:hypothetical protein
MKLNHVGLHIQIEEEIVNSYQNILGYNSEYQFDILVKLTNEIFGVNK